MPANADRLNAIRHGLTAETVVAGLEDAEEQRPEYAFDSHHPG
jgi:hypothetical protein